jgi:hypothetical protein
VKAQIDKMKRDAPDQYNDVIKILRPLSDGKTRSTSQLHSALTFMEEFSREICLKKKKGFLLLNRRQFIANMIYVQGVGRAKARLKWTACLSDKKVFQTKENGKTVVAVRQATGIDQEDILRSSQRFKGEELMVSAAAAQSLLTGPGPKLDKAGMKALTGTKKMFKSESEDDGDDGELDEDSGDESDGAASDAAGDGTSDESDGPPPLPPPQAKRRKGAEAAPNPTLNAARKSVGGAGKPGGGSTSVSPAKPARVAEQMAFVPLVAVSGKKNPREFLKEVKKFKSDVEKRYKISETVDEDEKVVSISDVLEREYTPYKDDGGVAALNIPGALTEFRHAEEALKESVKGIDSWRYGCDLGVKESEVSNFVDDYIAKVRTLFDFRACLLDMNSEKRGLHKADALKAKRGWRYQKQKLTKLLQKFQVPSVLAKACSALFTSGGGETAHLASTPYTSEFNGCFSNPVSFSLGLNTGEEGPTRLHKAFATWYDANQSIVKAKVAKNITSLKAKGSHGCVSVEEKSSFAFVGDESSSASDGDNCNVTALPMPSVLFIMQNYTLDTSISSRPFPGTAQLLQVMTGSMYVLCLAVCDVIGAGTTQAFFSSDNAAKVIAKSPQFVIGAKTALWIPFGYETIVIGLDIDEDNSEEEHKYTTFVSHYAFSSDDYSARDAEERVYIAARAQETLNVKFKFFDPSKSAVKDWKQKVEDETTAQDDSI